MKKQLIISFVIVSMLLFTGASTLFAQEGRGGGRVIGSVKNEKGEPLADVQIVLQSMSYNFNMETQSDKEGKWGFYGFSKDQYKITGTKEGYAPFETVQALSGINKNPVLDIVMAKPIPRAGQDASVDQAARAGLKKGNALYKEGKFQEALPYFKNFLAGHPEQYKMGINLANCYFHLKQYEDAVTVLKQVVEGFKKETPQLKGNTQVASIYANIGEAYSAMNNLDDAAAYYKKSMETAPPTDAAVAYNVAEILFNGGKTDEAIEYYSLAAKLKPKMAVYYSKLGYAYLNKGDIETAVSNFEKFVKMAPDDPQTPALQDLIKDLKQ